MALKITGVPECRALLGPSQWLRAYDLAPGISDYPAGGYPITADSVELSQLFGAWIIGQNAAAEHLYPVFVLPAAAFGPIPPLTPNPIPQTTIYLEVKETISSGAIYAFSEITVGTNINGFVWRAYFIGW